MAQHDYVIANGTGAAVRSDLNNGLSAIVTQNSGATEPTTTYAYMRWADTTAGVMKMRNGANSAWITLYQLDGEWSTIAFENGTAGAPSIYFKDSGTDTGFYSPGANQVGISTGGTARLTIDSNGNVDIDSNTLYVDATNNRVGLGTSSPDSLLHIQAASDARLRIKATGSGTGVNSTINLETASEGHWVIQSGNAASSGLRFYDVTAAQTRLLIDSSGRVGIGTTGPNTLLECTRSGTGDIARFGIDSSTYLNVGYSSNTFTLTSASSKSLAFNTTGSEVARFDSSGRLLVGTSTSRNVAATVGARLQVEHQASAGVHGLSVIDVVDSAIIAFGTNNGGSVCSNGKLLARINFGGNDGTDMQNSSAYIEAYADSTWGNDDVPGRLVFSTTADGASSPTENMRISANRNIRIGTVGTSYGVFDINNDGSSTYKLDYLSSGGNRLFAVQASNGTVVNSSGTYTTVSDVKLKENIVESPSQWQDIKALRVVKYNFKEETGYEQHTQIGLIAQEVEEVSPDLVFDIPDTDADGADLGTVTKGVKQSIVYMKAVKALQEAMERIEQLETEMAEIKAQLQAL
jgi:hypothetical protein